MTFRCVVCNGDGTSRSTVTVDAPDAESLFRRFEGSERLLISYDEVSGGHGSVRARSRVNAGTVIEFTENMAALMNSGLTVQEALKVGSQINGQPKNRQLCGELLSVLMKGEQLNAALSLYAPSFSPLYISLVRIGEASGSVNEVFSRLAKYLRTRKENAQKVLQAFIYPAAVLVTAVCVAACIIFFVFPKLKELFEVFTESSSEVAAGMARVYRSMAVSTGIFFLLLSCSILVFILYRSSPKAALKIDALLLKVPFIGQYIKISCTSDFSFAMELLCSSGIPLVQALGQSGDVSRNRAYRKAVTRVMDDIAKGGRLSSSFARQGVFPEYLVTWIGIGETTGNVGGVFSQIHDYYDKQSSRIIGNMIVSAEPVCTVITGIIIFFMVGQFVLPVFSLLGGL